LCIVCGADERGEPSQGNEDCVGKTDTHAVIQNEGGTQLQSVLSNKNLWKGAKCGRGDCHPCLQPSEVTQECRTTNIVYESMCSTCNPDGKTNLTGLQDQAYVGESSKSLKERAKEHHADFSARHEDSHMLKTWTGSHQGQEPPIFHQQVVRQYKTSLARQIGEAVRIQMRG
jgi:hypothetical protein